MESDHRSNPKAPHKTLTTTTTTTTTKREILNHLDNPEL